MPRSTRLLGVAAAVALLAGCGGDADQSTDDIDPCNLLTGDEIAGYLEGATPQGVREDSNGRPTCTWDDGEGHDLRLLIWNPPEPGIITEMPERTLEVGQFTGYVTIETSASCTLEVDADQAFISIDVSAFGDQDWCAEAAQSAGSVIERLGW